MKKRTVATILGLGCWVVVGACSGSDNGRPPPGGEIPLDAGRDGASRGDGGPSGDDGSSPEPDGSSEPFDGEISDAPMTPGIDAGMDEPTCNPSKTWASPTAVPGVAAFATQPLVTMTNDELTLAWVVSNGSGGNVFVADRTSTGASFGSPVQLMATSTGGSTSYVDGAAISDGGESYFAFDRVALTSDGLTLVGVAVGGLHMAEFTRDNRTAAFNPTPLESQYTDLASSLMPGEKLGDPVISTDGVDLVYSKYGKSPSLTVYEAFRPSVGATWPAGSGNGTMALAEDAGLRKHPTSMTADRRTLFVWDEAGEAYGILRPTKMTQFNYAIPFGNRFSIQINGACSRIYYVTPGSSGFSLVQADAN